MHDRAGRSRHTRLTNRWLWDKAAMGLKDLLKEKSGLSLNDLDDVAHQALPPKTPKIIGADLETTTGGTGGHRGDIRPPWPPAADWTTHTGRSRSGRRTIAFGKHSGIAFGKHSGPT
jgi:hypothetical protein